jgi:hypothetical protein
MKRDPWAKFKVNTPEQRMEYLAAWYRGYARRSGIEKAKLKLDEDPERDAIRETMRKNR